MHIKEGKKIKITIDNLSSEGQGIGRVDGLAVFVKGAMVGEECIVEIIKLKKKYAQAKLLKILKISPDRVSPLCPVANKCGGCQLSHMAYDQELEFKTQKVRDNLARIGNIDTIVFDTIGMKKPWNYRNKAQYPVAMENNERVFGFYESGSHKIVDIENCMLQHEASNTVMNIVKTWAVKHKISIYDEVNHIGLLRHVVVKIGYKTGDIMVILVTNGQEIPHKEQLIEKLSRVSSVKSIVLNVNTKNTNVIMGKQNIVLYGKPYVHDYIGDIKFRLSPLSFFQVNPIQVETLYDKALEYAGLTGEENVIDLYCGIGTISLYLARNAKKVYGVEIVSQAVLDARVNAKINGFQNVEFIEGAAEDVLPSLAKGGVKSDIIIVDPPRRGCDEKTLETMVQMAPSRIVYISCNPSTLARDLRYLEDRGYKTKKVQPVDMFPRTHHVECVVLMSRVEK